MKLQITNYLDIHLLHVKSLEQSIPISAEEMSALSIVLCFRALSIAMLRPDSMAVKHFVLTSVSVEASLCW
jgi:hypothetical protein